MPNRYSPYNAEIMAQKCPRETCQAEPLKRCRGSLAGGEYTPPHYARMAAAGLKWNKQTKEYEPLN